MKRRFVLAALLLRCAGSPAADYHVDARSGDDARDGLSPATAWRSLEKAGAVALQPGDQLLLRAGSSWTGTLRPKGSGDAGRPVALDAYGEGPLPVIHGGGSAGGAVRLENQQHWRVRRLEITNRGGPEPRKVGLKVVNRGVGTLSDIEVSSCVIHDVEGDLADYRDGKESGAIVFLVEVGQRAVPSRWDGVRIEGNTIRDVGRSGILLQSHWINRPEHTNSSWRGLGDYTASTNVRIAGNRLENIRGDGIVLWCVQGGVVESNFVRRANDNALGQGHAGIWPYFCEDTVFQYNEVCETRTTFDGMAFDFDNGNRRCVYQYNYSHDNEGGFLNMCCDGYAEGNIARFNVSSNDGCAARSRVFLVHGNGNRGYRIHDNTILYGPGDPALFEQGAPSDGSSILFASNLIVNAGTGTVQAPPGCRFEGNRYRGPGRLEPEGAVAAIPESSYDWWRAARFGIFIHWNASSVLELGEGSWSRKNPADHGFDYHRKGLNRMAKEPPPAIADGSYRKWLRQGGVPMEVYDNLYHVFNPHAFDADAWAEMFRAAGAGYIVFTTKHHDGFCMFDSQQTDYDIMRTPFRRDIAKELAEACRRRGIKVIWYYSKCDWFDPRHDVDRPGPYVDYLTAQVRELLTNYGEIAGLWWDAGQIAIPTRPLFDMILALQPGIISNGRIQSPGQAVPGVSFGTPEQELGAFNMQSPWESCVTMQGEGWFWNGGLDVRTASSCLRLLVNCAAGDGNLLLDFGPDAEGRIHPTVRDNYLALGRWLSDYGRSIRGTRGGPYLPDHWGGSTRSGNTVFAHITQAWPGGKLRLPPLPRKVVSATALTGGAVGVTQSPDGIELALDPRHHQPVDTVVALELDGSAMDLDLIPGARGPWSSLTVDAAVSASSTASSWAATAPEGVVLHAWETNGPSAPPRGLESLSGKPRGHVWRAWMARNDDPRPWLALDLGAPRTFDQVCLREKFTRIRGFQLQAEQGGAWRTLYAGRELDAFSLHLPESVTAQKVRLLVTESIREEGVSFQGPGLQEFDLYLTQAPYGAPTNGAFVARP